MTKRKLFTFAENAEENDFDDMGLYAREGDDNIVGGAIDYPHHWADFTVSLPSSVEARVNPGRFFSAEKVYDADEPIDINVQSDLPITSGDKRYIALLVRGATVTENAERLVEVDAETEETVLMPLPKTEKRIVEIVVQRGNVSPTPTKPAIATDACCLAYLLLSQTGIVSAELNEPHRVKTLYELSSRVDTIQTDVERTEQRTDSLETDISNVANQLRQVPRPEIIRQLQRDTGNLRRLLFLPDEARSYWYDAGLVLDDWDTAHASWLARVNEGVRFQYAAERDSQLALYDPDNEAISLYGGSLLMPAYTEVTRLAIEGNDGAKNISQIVHTVTTAVRREIARTAVRYGATVAVCENQAEWSQVGAAARAGSTLSVAGETFAVVGLVTDPNSGVDLDNIHTWNPEATVEGVVAWNADPQSAGHKAYAVQQLQYDSWTEVYWDYVTESFGVNGSTYAQSFLVAKPMVATSIELFFTRVGTASGDVHLMLMECNATGAPDFKRVISKTMVPQASLQLGWTKFAFRPSLLEAGKRYAWATVTTGNHALAFVSGNKFAQGTLFWSTDGEWAQGSPEEDFAFRLNGAQFTAPRTVVEFDPLTLAGGMTELRLVWEGWEPAGTAIVWEIKPSGADSWQRLVPMSANPLTGLPALTRLRATFLGTTDLQPAIQMNSKARGMTYRHRTDMVAISKNFAFGFSTTDVQVDVQVDNYSSVHHTCVPKLVVGSTVYTAGVITTTQDPNKLSRTRILATFTIPSSSGCRVRVDMTTDSNTFVPFIQNIARYAI